MSQLSLSIPRGQTQRPPGYLHSHSLWSRAPSLPHYPGHSSHHTARVWLPDGLSYSPDRPGRAGHKNSGRALEELLGSRGLSGPPTTWEDNAGSKEVVPWRWIEGRDAAGSGQPTPKWLLWSLRQSNREKSEFTSHRVSLKREMSFSISSPCFLPSVWGDLSGARAGMVATRTLP